MLPEFKNKIMIKRFEIKKINSLISAIIDNTADEINTPKNIMCNYA